MSEPTYGFKDKNVATNLRETGLQDPPRSTAEPAFMTQNFTFLVQTPSEGIPAMSGTTPGKAFCVALDIIPAGITDTINYAGTGPPFAPLEVEVTNTTRAKIDGDIIITATIAICTRSNAEYPPVSESATTAARNGSPHR